MSVTSVRNVLQVMIGKSVSSTGSAVQLTSPTGASYIADGEIVVLGTTNQYLTPGSTITDHEFIKLAYRSGSKIHYSNRIYGKNVNKYAATSGTQGQEQIYHIGFTGSGTSNIDVSEGNDFYLHITNTFNTMQYSQQQDRRTYFSTFAVPTAEKVAGDLVKQICIDPGSQIKGELLNSSTTHTHLTGLTVTVVNNSKTVSCSGAHSLVAGDYIRIGTTTVASGVGAGIPVYKIAAAPSTTTLTLEWPYQGPSQANLSGTNDCAKVTVSGIWGIRLTGETIPFRLDFFSLLRCTFKAGLKGLGSTILTKTQEASYGKGDGRKVAELESFAQGFEGNMNRVTVPLPEYRTDAVKTTTETQNATYGNSFVTASTIYDCITIQSGNAAPHFATAPVPASEEFRLYIVDGASQETGILAQLNPYLESAGLPAVSL